MAAKDSVKKSQELANCSSYNRNAFGHHRSYINSRYGFSIVLPLLHMKTEDEGGDVLLSDG